MYKQIYRIENLTNLHVGDMGSSFGVVDNTVQKDPVTGLACVYATSLKGALRSAAEIAELDCVNAIFGSGVRDNTKTKGGYRFHDAQLLFYPVRSSKRAYYMATCPSLLKEARMLFAPLGFKELEESLGKLAKLSGNFLYLKNKGTTDKVHVEDWLFNVKDLDDTLQAVLGLWLPQEPGLLIVSDDLMMQFAGEGLPVIARNQLENGVSNNLWYEELVPRHTVFYTVVLADEENKAFSGFLAENLIQIGANATVGYGLCRFRAMGGDTCE